jgi:hypothetical protein
MRWVIITAVIALISIFGLMLALSLERRTETKDVGFQGEARTNPYLAAERFLNEMEIPAQSKVGFSGYEDLNRSVMILASTRFTLGQQRAEAVYKWVAGGGHLIMIYQENDDLFFETPVEEFPDVIHTDDQQSSNFRYTYGGSEYQITQQYIFYDYDRGEDLFTLEFDYGEGRITWLPEFKFATNRTIAAKDHAAFLLALVRARYDQPEAVWLVYRETFPSIWNLLFQQARAVIVAALLFLIVLIWHKMPRFGPIRPDPPLARRRLLEHLSASALFYRTHGMSDHLIEVTRAALWRHIRRLYPHWSSLTKEALSQHINNKTGLSETMISEALEHNGTWSEESLVRAIGNLEFMRRTL